MQFIHASMLIFTFGLSQNLFGITGECRVNNDNQPVVVLENILTNHSYHVVIQAKDTGRKISRPLNQNPSANVVIPSNIINPEVGGVVDITIPDHFGEGVPYTFQCEFPAVFKEQNTPVNEPVPNQTRQLFIQQLESRFQNLNIQNHNDYINAFNKAYLAHSFSPANQFYLLGYNQGLAEGRTDGVRQGHIQGSQEGRLSGEAEAKSYHRSIARGEIPKALPIGYTVGSRAYQFGPKLPYDLEARIQREFSNLVSELLITIPLRNSDPTAMQSCGTRLGHLIADAEAKQRGYAQGFRQGLTETGTQAYAQAYDTAFYNSYNAMLYQLENTVSLEFNTLMVRFSDSRQPNTFDLEISGTNIGGSPSSHVPVHVLLPAELRLTTPIAIQVGRKSDFHFIFPGYIRIQSPIRANQIYPIKETTGGRVFHFTLTTEQLLDQLYLSEFSSSNQQILLDSIATTIAAEWYAHASMFSTDIYAKSMTENHNASELSKLVTAAKKFAGAHPHTNQLLHKRLKNMPRSFWSQMCWNKNASFHTLLDQLQTP